MLFLTHSPSRVLLYLFIADPQDPRDSLYFLCFFFNRFDGNGSRGRDRGREFGGVAVSGGRGKGGEHSSFMMRMEKLKDESLTNLYFEGVFFLPVDLVIAVGYSDDIDVCISLSLSLVLLDFRWASTNLCVRWFFCVLLCSWPWLCLLTIISKQTLAALVSHYVIKSSRFFQTKFLNPPRIIAFVRYVFYSLPSPFRFRFVCKDKPLT